MEIDMDGTKECTYRSKVYPKAEFNIDRGRVGGCDYICRSCRRLFNIVKAMKSMIKNDIVDLNGFKFCFPCKIIQPRIKFSFCLIVKGGLSCYCRGCSTILKKHNVKQIKLIINYEGDKECSKCHCETKN